MYVIRQKGLTSRRPAAILGLVIAVTMLSSCYAPARNDEIVGEWTATTDSVRRMSARRPPARLDVSRTLFEFKADGTFRAEYAPLLMISLSPGDISKLFDGKGKWYLEESRGAYIVRLVFDVGGDQSPITTELQVRRTGAQLYLFDYLDPDSGPEIIYERYPRRS
jgi:hypothetical protein